MADMGSSRESGLPFGALKNMHSLNYNSSHKGFYKQSLVSSSPATADTPGLPPILNPLNPKS